MSEKKHARAKIDAMAKTITDADPHMSPERAKKIARDAARRHEHGESIHTEGRKPRT